MTRYLPPEPAGAGAARLRLFCFPFAGGGATAYSGWQRRLGRAVRVVPVRLPGREARIGEPRFTEFGALIDDLDAQLGPALDQGPYALFGHSMGAMIAYALAHRRHRAGRRPPKALMLSAYRPPHLGVPKLFEAVQALRTREALMDALIALGGIPAELLARPDWMALLLPIAADDLLMCSTVPRWPADPIPVPLQLFAAADDALVTPSEVAEWARHTDAGSELTVFPGNHFYLREREQETLRHISGLLAGYCAEVGDDTAAADASQDAVSNETVPSEAAPDEGARESAAWDALVSSRA